MKITTKHLYLDNLLLGVLAGVAIGLGGLINLALLSIGQKILGGICFSVGLLTVCYFSLHLYTGKIGYLTENKKNYLLSLLIMYIGNIIGAVGFGYILRACNIMDSSLASTIIKVSNKKVLDIGSGSGQTWMALLGLGFMCGTLVFIGVDIYKKNTNWLFKILGIVVAVATFVILGMEHCVADMFYLAIGNAYASKPLESILALLIITLGNSIGSLVLYQVINNSSIKKNF